MDDYWPGDTHPHTAHRDDQMHVSSSYVVSSQQETSQVLATNAVSSATPGTPYHCLFMHCDMLLRSHDLKKHTEDVHFRLARKCPRCGAAITDVPSNERKCATRTCGRIFEEEDIAPYPKEGYRYVCGPCDKIYDTAILLVKHVESSEHSRDIPLTQAWTQYSELLTLTKAEHGDRRSSASSAVAAISADETLGDTLWQLVRKLTFGATNTQEEVRLFFQKVDNAPAS